MSFRLHGAIVQRRGSGIHHLHPGSLSRSLLGFYLGSSLSSVRDSQRIPPRISTHFKSVQLISVSSLPPCSACCRVAATSRFVISAGESACAIEAIDRIAL